MPVKKLKNGRYAVISYTTGKRLKRTYATKAAAQRRAATSKRRSRRERSTGSKRAKVGGRNYSPSAVRKRVAARKSKRRY